MARVTVCMMVKNEQRNLRRCLESVRPIADELIVVDTGSTDATMQIAREYGARLFESPWRDDFSYHRNESLAPATGDWVLIIDADEEMIIADGVDLREQLDAIGNECHATRMWVEDIQAGRVAMRHQTNRIFRRGMVRYEDRKHNFPVFEGDTMAQLFGVRIRHYGYNADQIAGKRDRDRELLEKMRVEKPEDPKVLFYLAQTIGTYDRDWPAALEFCLEYIERAKDDASFQPAAYVSGAEIARNAAEPETARRLIDEGLKRYPGDVDLLFLKVRESALANDPDQSIAWAAKYLEAYNRLTVSPHEHDSRFLFYFSEDAVLDVLHKAAISHLYKGLEAMREFRGQMPGASEAAREEVAGLMTTDLKHLDQQFGCEMGAAWASAT